MAPNDDPQWFANGQAYDRYMGRWSRPVGVLFVEWLALPDRLRWIDIGCGTGALCATLIERASPGSVIGIEPSAGFLGVARSMVVDDRVDFRSGDAQDLPLEDDSADVAVSGLVLNFVPDKVRAVREMRRTVRLGGTVAAYVWDYAGGMQLIRHFWDGVSALFPLAAAKDQAELFPICDPQALAALFREAGLQDVETSTMDTPTLFADFDDFWSPFLGGQGPAGAFCASLSDTDRERLRGHLQASLPTRPDGSIHLTARALAVRGRR